MALPVPLEMCEGHDGAPPSIFANIADGINEVSSASHRCGYLQNTALARQLDATLYVDHMCLPSTRESDTYSQHNVFTISAHGTAHRHFLLTQF
jgi:hypothetical protein